MNFMLKTFVFCLAVNLAFGLMCWECNNALTNEECLETGSLNECVEDEAICEDQIRHEDEGRVVIIEKRCKQRLACDNNVAQNQRPAYPIQCHIGSPTSACRCCCSTDGCNRDLLACWEAYPSIEPFVIQECPSLPNAPANGNMQCQGNKEPGTTCDFTCHQDYYIAGQPRLTCLEDLSWDYPEPECLLKQCFPERLRLGNGTVTCTDDNNLRSRCRFQCRKNFGLVGNEFTECRDAGDRFPRTGLWSNPVPRCKALICPPQGPIDHGGFSCTDRRKLGSVCTWQCMGAFEVFPPGFEQNVCLENGQWDKPWPCCSLACLPFAVVDLLVILDSSSSVGSDNWDLMVDFVGMLFSHFALQPDAAQFAVFRYNRVVDTRTQILFSDYRSSIEDFLTAFRRIQYDGSGTNTGNALNHAVDNVLPIGNREIAGDVVMLITDGASQDDIAFPARRIRATGAEILVIPVRPPSGAALNLEPFFNIAGNRANVYTQAAEGGFEALDELFAVTLANELCPPPCSNPFHDHDPVLPERLRPYANFTRGNN